MGRTLGQALVSGTPDWDWMDRAAVEQWWAALMRGQRWYIVGEAKRS